MRAGKKRLANFELLRMLAMLMVVTMHFLSRTGSLPEAGQELTERTAAAILIEAFCIVAVNVYVFISGYFLSESGFSLKRLLRLLCQVLFYTLLIPPVLVLAVMGTTGTPSSRDRRSMSILSPWAWTSSIKFKASTMGRSSSSSCTVT